MEYISSDTNIWLDFATIKKLEAPFKLPYTYIMNEDAITDELLSPKELRENLIGLGLQAVELSEEEFYLAEEYVNCLKALSENNGQKVRLPEEELQKRVEDVERQQ